MPRGSRETKLSALTAAEEAFAQHYVLHRNGAQAYRHAFPKSRKWKPQTVAVRASELLNTGKVQGRLTVLQLKVQSVAAETFEISAAKVLQELAAIAFAKPGDYFKWGVKTFKRKRKAGKDEHGNQKFEEYEIELPYIDVTPSGELTETQLKAVVGPDLTADKFGNLMPGLKMADRMKALQLLGQHLALFDGKNPTKAPSLSGTIKHEHTHTFEIDETDDPKAALRMFESFRMNALGRTAGNA